MKKIILSAVTLSLILSFSCNETKEIEKEVIIQEDTTLRSEHLSMATVWFQKSAESRAVYYQTFNLAKMVIENKLKGGFFKKLKKSKPLAVITDIDETILDNSPYNALLLEKGTSYDRESWKEWVMQKRAKALPGALDFCKFAKEKGIEVFYVSNRHNDQIAATLENLKTEGFPYADSSHVLLKTETSNKTERRNKVLESYTVIMYLGDNLRDFDEIFGDRGEDLGFNIVSENKDKFGAEFIVFPNPIYGEWEKAVYKGDYSKTNEEKRQMRKDVLDK
jgi:5'-nucleotidase (lipoprotein e(P4) family)